jgi:hypothetical protein
MDEDMSTIDNLKKADVIKRIVARSIDGKAWRSAAEQEAMAYLDKSEKGRRSDVIAYVKAEYDKAGAGFNGRWQ